MKISTKSGDGGESGTFSGRRLPKSDLFFDVLGDLDELNSVLGWVKVVIKEKEVMERIQKNVYGIMSEVGVEGDVLKLPESLERVGQRDVEDLENSIARLELQNDNLRQFVAPGGSELGTRLHLARTVCRRAERALIRYGEKVNLSKYLQIYLNRLSDLLFLMALDAG